MLEDLVVNHVWLAIGLWAVLYTSDYYLTIGAARLYQAGVKEHIVFEGSYELTPYYQSDVNALRSFSPRFLGVLILSSALLLLIWVLAVRVMDLPGVFSFAVGAMVLLEAAIHIRHLRNLALFRAILNGAEGITGKIQYAKAVSLRQLAVELSGFAVLFLLAAALTACLPRSATEYWTPTPTLTPIPLSPTLAPTAVATRAETPTATRLDTAAILRAYPRVDGSTSTYPLEVMATCVLLEVPCIWQPEGPASGVERFLMPDPQFLDAAKEAIFNPIVHWGTHEAYVNLIEGEADFILVARGPSVDELRAADEQGVQLDVRPVALDAFVFLANADNPVDGINLDQARRIYTGEITNWSALGGPNRPIQAYQRDPNSGSQELMAALVMQGAPMIEAPDMILFTMIGPVNAIHDDLGGIGYSVYYYAAFIMPDEQVKLLAVEGVAPTSESIARRAYPLTTEVYAAVRQGTPASSPAILLRDWLLTPDGQAAVAASGYVPVR